MRPSHISVRSQQPLCGYSDLAVDLLIECKATVDSDDQACQPRDQMRVGVVLLVSWCIAFAGITTIRHTEMMHRLGNGGLCTMLRNVVM